VYVSPEPKKRAATPTPDNEEVYNNAFVYLCITYILVYIFLEPKKQATSPKTDNGEVCNHMSIYIYVHNYICVHVSRVEKNYQVGSHTQVGQTRRTQ